MSRTPTETPGRAELRDWMERAHYETQNDAAEALGLHPVVFSQYLSGTRRPDIDTALRIQERSGIAVECWRLNDISREYRNQSVASKRPAKTGR